MNQSTRVAVKHLYRQILRHAELLPAGQGAPTISEAREKFRDNINLEDSSKIAEKIKEAHSRLQFLRATTPRSRYTQKEANSGIRRFVVSESGDLHEGTAGFRGIRAYWDSHNPVDPDDLNRHKRLLRRMRFGREW